MEFSSRCQRFMNISALSACSDCHGYWCRRFWCRPFKNATPALHRYNSPFQDCYRLSCFKNITAVTASRMNVSGTTALTLLPVVRSKAIITVALIPQYFLTASGMLPLRRLQARCRCQTLSPLVRGYRCYRYHRFKILPLYLCVVLCCYAHHSFELADIVATLSITNVTASRLWCCDANCKPLKTATAVTVTASTILCRGRRFDAVTLEAASEIWYTCHGHRITCYRSALMNVPLQNDYGCSFYNMMWAVMFSRMLPVSPFLRCYYCLTLPQEDTAPTHCPHFIPFLHG